MNFRERVAEEWVNVMSVTIQVLVILIISLYSDLLYGGFRALCSGGHWQILSTISELVG